MGSFGNVCRLCSSVIKGTGVDLFNEEHNYFEQIKSCFKILLLHLEHAPKKICCNCVFELENICSFRERCIKAQKSFELVCKKSLYIIIEDTNVTNQNCIGSVPTNNVRLSLPEQDQVMIINNQPVTMVNLDQNSVLCYDQKNTVPPEQLSLLYPVKNCNVQTQALNQASLVNNLTNQQTSYVFQNRNSVVLHNQTEDVKPSVLEVVDISSSDSGTDNDTESVMTRLANGIKMEPAGGSQNYSTGDAKITVDIVKKVKTELLDAHENMASHVHSAKQVISSTLLYTPVDEFIVGSQMDDQLFKAIIANQRVEELSNAKNEIGIDLQTSTATFNEQSRFSTSKTSRALNGVHNKDSFNTSKQNQISETVPVQNDVKMERVRSKTSKHVDERSRLATPKTSPVHNKDSFNTAKKDQIIEIVPVQNDVKKKRVRNRTTKRVDDKHRKKSISSQKVGKCAEQQSLSDSPNSTLKNVPYQQHLLQPTASDQRASVIKEALKYTCDTDVQNVATPISSTKKRVADDPVDTPRTGFQCTVCDKVLKNECTIQKHIKRHCV